VSRRRSESPVIGWRREIEIMSGNKRIPTDGGPSFGQTPFAELNSNGLPPGPKERSKGSAERPMAESTAPPKNRGRVDIKRQTAGRGGKTVTVVTGFVGIGLPEKEKLAKQIQKACGAGGTVKDGRIEIQGDKRAEVARTLTEAGFRPVFAGG
jgi:translation initiation factor 1